MVNVSALETVATQHVLKCNAFALPAPARAAPSDAPTDTAAFAAIAPLLIHGTLTVSSTLCIRYDIGSL